MRKSKLSGRDDEIRSRLREARVRLGFDQAECARQIGLKRSTLLNYELGLTPLRFEVALRFCRQFIVSEEWLATGRCEACHKASPDISINRKTDTPDIDRKIFFRQTMDLLSEPASLHLPNGMSFAEAYDTVLRHDYARIVQANYFLPRIVFSNSDSPELACNLLNAINERFIILLNNEALRRGQKPQSAWRVYAACMLESGDLIFRKMMRFKLDSKSMARLSWLRNCTCDPDSTIPFLDENGVWPVPQTPENSLTDDSVNRNSGGVKPEIKRLIARVNAKASQPGSKAELARMLDVAPARISEWLSGKNEPGGETTLRLLQWVEQQERQK